MWSYSYTKSFCTIRTKEGNVTEDLGAGKQTGPIQHWPVDKATVSSYRAGKYVERAF
jgi:hypothetical protein